MGTTPAAAQSACDRTFSGDCPGSLLQISGRCRRLKVLPVDLKISPRPVGIMTLKNRTLSSRG